LRDARRVAGRAAEADEEPEVSSDAVADLAEPGDVHEQALLEE